MKDLLLSVMTVSLCAGVINLLAPEGKLKPSVTFVTALVLCAALFSPLIRLLGKEISVDLSLSSVPSREGEAAQEAILRLTGEALSRQLEEEVSLRFAISSPTLTLVLDGTDPTAVVIQSGQLCGHGQVAEAAAYLTERLACPVAADVIQEEEPHESS